MGVRRWRGRGHYRSHLPSTDHTALPPGSHPSYTLYSNLNTIHLKALALSVSEIHFYKIKAGEVDQTPASEREGGGGCGVQGGWVQGK